MGRDYRCADGAVQCTPHPHSVRLSIICAPGSGRAERPAPSSSEFAMSRTTPRPVHVLLMSGSLRRESLNHRLVELAAAAAERAGATTDLARIAEFDAPFYDGDLERKSGIPN